MFKFYELLTYIRFEDKKVGNPWLYSQAWEIYFHRWYELFTDLYIGDR